MAKAITIKQMASILAKAARNPAFKKKLLASPAKTLAAQGFEPHKQAVSVIRSLKHKSFSAAPKAKGRPRKTKKRDPHAASAAES